MNLLADRMEPYLRASGIRYVRNDPDRNVSGAIADSNADSYDVHLALHSNAAPEDLAGQLWENSNRALGIGEQGKEAINGHN